MRRAASAMTVQPSIPKTKPKQSQISKAKFQSQAEERNEK